MWSCLFLIFKFFKTNCFQMTFRKATAHETVNTCLIKKIVELTVNETTWVCWNFVKCTLLEEMPVQTNNILSCLTRLLSCEMECCNKHNQANTRGLNQQEYLSWLIMVFLTFWRKLHFLFKWMDKTGENNLKIQF